MRSRSRWNADRVGASASGNRRPRLRSGQLANEARGDIEAGAPASGPSRDVTDRNSLQSPRSPRYLARRAPSPVPARRSAQI